MAWIGAAITGAAGLASSAMGAIGQSNLNIANRDFSASQADIQRQWEAQQQQKAMNYNTFMSDTAEQRRVADLKKAGLNPNLSIMGIGSASAPQMGAPSGAMANTPNTQNPFGNMGLGQTAASAVQAYKDQKTAENTAVDTKLKQAQLPYAAASAAKTYMNLTELGQQIHNDAQLAAYRTDFQIEQTDRFINESAWLRDMWPLYQKAQQYDVMAKEYGLAPLKTQAWWWKSPMAAVDYAAQQGYQGGGYPGAIASSAYAARRLGQQGLAFDITSGGQAAFEHARQNSLPVPTTEAGE